MTQRVKVLATEPDDSWVPQVLHSGRKKPTWTSCPLTSGCTLWYAPPPLNKPSQTSTLAQCDRSFRYCLVVHSGGKAVHHRTQPVSDEPGDTW